MSCFSPRTNLKILLYHYGPNLAALFTRPIEVSGTIHMRKASRIWPCAWSLSKNTVKQRIMDNGPLILSCRKPKKRRKFTRETPYCSQWAGTKTAPPPRDSYTANKWGTSNEIFQQHLPSDIRICESWGPAFSSGFLEFTCEQATGRPPSKIYLTLLWARNEMDCPEKYKWM